MEWRCFHCNFVTSDKEAALAHFGDPDELEPVCCDWERMSKKERLGEFQALIQELNGEREENGRLLDRIRELERRA
jgi:hypothetical protein